MSTAVVFEGAGFGGREDFSSAAFGAETISSLLVPYNDRMAVPSRLLLAQNAVAGIVFLAMLGCGTGSTPPANPPTKVEPPSPESVTRDHPGGDSVEPHVAALTRLLESPWGHRVDKDDQLLVPLPDAEHWKRVRFFGVDHFVGFRYGKDHHAMVAVFVQKVEPADLSSEKCLRRFEQWGRPLIQPFDVDFSPFTVRHGRFRKKPVITLAVDGSLTFGFSRPEFSAAWTAYPIYPDACLVAAVGIPWRKHPELARAVRNRFVEEGFGLLNPLTEEAPYRH